MKQNEHERDFDFGMSTSMRHHAGYTTVRYDMNHQHGLQFPYGHPAAYGSMPGMGSMGSMPGMNSMNSIGPVGSVGPPMMGHHANPTSIVFTSQQFVPYYHGGMGVGGWTSVHEEGGAPGHHGHPGTLGMHGHGHAHQRPLARTNSGPKSAAGHASGEASKGKQPMAPPSTLGNLWTSSALPAIEDNNEDSPDLERFLRASTPRFKLSADLNSLRDFKLMDVWKHFERISAYGLRCATYGGPLGPSSSYFVPFLSSIQLFEPVEDATTGGDDDDILEYPEGLEAWPRRMRRVFGWGAKNHVGERLPLNQQVLELCGAEGPAHVLASSKVSQLHPYSWFAVAWYPLYRVPEAPLNARFLTFHSLAPLWEAAQQSVADRRSISALHPGSAGTANVPPMMSRVESEPGMSSSSSSSRKARPTSHRSSSSFGNVSIGSEMLSSKTDRTEKTDRGVLGAFPESTASERSNSDGSSQKLGDVDVDVDGERSNSDVGAGKEECIEHEKSPSCGATTISSTASLSKIELPPVGLCWHIGNAHSRSRRLPSENWTDTMVKLSADVDQTRLSSGDSLPGSTNACVVNVSSGYVVVKKNYPLSKGGPLSWDIQMEELAEGAKRLALGVGIVSANDGAGTRPAADPTAADIADACPDYAFFLSRAASMTHRGR